MVGVQEELPQEKTYNVSSEFRIDIQMNSDNYFDYTIYQNGKHLDGGILENIHGYEGIPDYAITEILKMHDLEQYPLETYYGYIYNIEGTHGDKLGFEGTPENIANFIMYNKNNACVITDSLDNFVASSTAGGFLDRVSDPITRDEILEKILLLQLNEKEPIDVTKQDIQRDPIEELARDLDDFTFDYDFYGYQDAIEDRTEHIESLISNLKTGNVEGLTDYLKEVIEEGTYMVPEASALLGRIEAIIPEQEKENHLKNTEMQVEDDYGMIDGIINNGEKEEKPSIINDLKEFKKEVAEKNETYKEITKGKSKCLEEI